MGADGALRSDVINALVSHGCIVEHMEDGFYRIGKGSSLVQAVDLPEVVSRTKLKQIGRLFGPTMRDFFPPTSA